MSINFLNYKLWSDAIELLNFQVEQKKKNKHYRTLNMEYFEKIDPLYKKEMNTEKYFNERIKSGIFYGLETEFFGLKYPKPKSLFGIRNYNFISYSLNVLHYTISLYLLKITQELLEYIKEDSHIKAFYGGNLLYNDNKLTITKKTTYYLNYYKEFKKTIKRSVMNENKNNFIVVKIDIENYFDNISIKKLLENINGLVKNSILNKNDFDEKSIIDIENFYKFLLYGKDGIPQSDNNIMSGFIGYLYLVFADLKISTKVRDIGTNQIKDYKIVRYVDDIYIILEFQEDTLDEIKKNSSLKILTEISDLLYYNFNLKINKKTKIFDLETENGLEDLLLELKKVSLEFEDFPDEEKSEKLPQEKFDIIMDKIKYYIDSQDINLFISNDDDSSNEIFKEIYDPAVSHITKKKENLKKIENILENINYLNCNSKLN